MLVSQEEFTSPWRSVSQQSDEIEPSLRYALGKWIYYTHSGLWTGKIYWFHSECCDNGYSWGLHQKQFDLFHSYCLTWIPVKKHHPLVDDSHFPLLISGLFTRASAFYIQLHYRTYFLGCHLTHNMIRLILTFSPFLNFLIAPPPQSPSPNFPGFRNLLVHLNDYQYSIFTLYLQK